MDNPSFNHTSCGDTWRCSAFLQCHKLIWNNSFVLGVVWSQTPWFPPLGHASSCSGSKVVGCRRFSPDWLASGWCQVETINWGWQLKYLSPNNQGKSPSFQIDCVPTVLDSYMAVGQSPVHRIKVSNSCHTSVAVRISECVPGLVVRIPAIWMRCLDQSLC